MITTTYNIYYGWDVSNYKEKGVRYVAYFIKIGQKKTDKLYVKYTDGTSDTINGSFIIPTIQETKQYINNQKISETITITNQIEKLQTDLRNINDIYDNIYYEPEIYNFL